MRVMKNAGRGNFAAPRILYYTFSTSVKNFSKYFAFSCARSKDCSVSGGREGFLRQKPQLPFLSTSIFPCGKKKGKL